MPIHYPPGGIDDSLRRSALGDIPGLRLPKRAILSKSAASAGGSLKNAAARLTLCLDNNVRHERLCQEALCILPNSHHIRLLAYQLVIMSGVNLKRVV